MKKIQKSILVLYFFVCPLEMAINIVIGSSTKYVGILLLGIWLIGLPLREKTYIRIGKPIIPTLLWLLFCVLSLSWGDSSRLTNEYLKIYLMMGLLVFISQEELWEEKDINTYLVAYLFGTIILALIVLLFGDSRYSERETVVILGSYCDPNQIAANIVPGVGLSLWLLFRNDIKNGFKVFGIGALLLLSYSVLSTGSRGGFLGLALGIVPLMILKTDKGAVKSKILVISLAVAVILVLRFMPSIFNMRALNFDSYRETYSTGRSRVTIWNDLLSTFNAQWLIGHGVGSTGFFMPQIYGYIVGVHNTFLLVLYEVGIIGFILFISPYLFMIVYHSINKNSIFVALIVAALTCSFFLDTLNLRYIWNCLILATMQYNVEQIELAQNERQQFCKYIKQMG